MTTWLCLLDRSAVFDPKVGPWQAVPRRRVNLDVEPSPVIAAWGLANVKARQTWIEDDGMPPPDPAASVKPPYRVPTMTEIRAIKPNDLRMVSTFSGCGGSCLGFRMAGFEVLWASEFIPAAQEVYRANPSPTTHLDTRDIRQVTVENILSQTGLAPGELDVFEGSPPCASFSTAGKREAGWGQVKKYSDSRQRTDDLFFEYARLLEGLQPRVFVAENVAGLIKGTAKGYFKLILARLRECGYRVEAKVLDAQWLGVPQSRQRLIFVGVRNDLGGVPVFPRPLPYRYSVRDALPELAGFHSKAHGYYDGGFVSGDRPAPTLPASPNGAAYNGHGVEPLTPGDEGGLDRYAIGRELDKLAPGQQSEKYFQLVRPHPDRPSPTVTAIGGAGGVASVAHPIERRKFTIAELRRICAFPDDFVLTGSYAQQWERLGRVVPPVMMRAVAEAIRDRVLA